MALAGALTAATSSVSAQPRPSSVRMTCDQARALVAARGAIVLGTGGDTFDRYVVHRGFCPVTDIIKPAWVPTRDVPQCMVGYRCVDPGPFLPR
jgi:hypothetical protein